MRIERLIKEHNVQIKWVHFPLHPDTPENGMTLEELFAGRGFNIPDMQQQMKDRMQAEGLDYGTRTHTYNSRLAQELGIWADTTASGDRYHDAVFRAYFVDARNVGDAEVLMDIVDSVGLDKAMARDILDQRSFKDAVDADWSRSRQMGVTGVPTFVAGGQGVAGAQPYDVLVSLVEQAASGD